MVTVLPEGIEWSVMRIRRDGRNNTEKAVGAAYGSNG
jgi:hypothetical protein